MSFLDDVSTVRQEVLIGVTNQTTDRSIKKVAVSGILNGILDLLTEVYGGPTGIIQGLGLTIDASNVDVAPGSWNIDGQQFTSSSIVSLPLEVQDASQSRFDIAYADNTGAILLSSGTLSLTPVEPDIPDGAIALGSILITPTSVNVNPQPGNYVTTNTNQTSLNGNKFWSGTHTFRKAPVFKVVGTGTLVTALGVDSFGNLIAAPSLSYTFSNGLTLGGSNVTLGGTLTQNTTIAGGAFNFTMTGGTTGGSQTQFLFNASNALLSGKPNGLTGGYLLGTSVNSTIGYGNGAVMGFQNGIGNYSTIVVNETLMNVLDPHNSKGLCYGADYSSNSGTNPRWIPDVGWVLNNFGNYLPLAGGTMSGDIQQPAAPVNGNSLVNRAYIDNLIIGAIIVGADTDSTTNITLSGEQTLNGVITNQSRIFVHGQTDQTANGIYVSGTGTWTRASDATTPDQILRLSVIIEGGTNKGQLWYNSNSAINLGTTNITFGQAGGQTYSNGTGLLLSSNTFSIDATYTATTSRTGYLSSSDWNTFNNKQVAGNYITALTGDVTANGPGSSVATLAISGVTPGAYTNANITVDSKGRVTAAANGSSGGGTTTNAITFNNSGAGAASPTTFNGSAAQIISWNTIGATSRTQISAVSNGLTSFGDSITYGTGTTSPVSATPYFRNAYSYLVGQAVGGPYLNYGKSGDQAADMAYIWVFPNCNPQGFGLDPIYMQAIGTNDVTVYNSSTAKQNIFNRTILATLSWAAIPRGNKRFAQAGTLSGFTADNNIQSGLGVTSTTNGNTLTMTISTLISSYIYLWYLIKDGNTGTFTVSIDGTLQADPYTSSTTINAFGDSSATIATTNGTTSSIVCLRMPVATSGSHTVVVTNTGVTGQTITIYGIGTNPATSTNNPYVLAISPNHQNNGNDTLSGTYAGFVSTTTTTLASDRLNVSYVNSRDVLGTNFAGYFSDTLHPNNTGHNLIATTTIGVIPTAKLIGQTLPYIYQESQNLIDTAPLNPSQFQTPNGANLNSSNTWNPGILWARNNGNMFFTTYQGNTGISNLMPAIGSAIGYSIGIYGTPGSGISPSMPPTTSTMYMTVTTNGQFGFFTNSSNVSGTLTMQQNLVGIGPLSFRGSNTFSSGFANNFIGNTTLATSSVNQPSNTLWWSANIWSGTASIFDDLGFVNRANGSGINPPMALTLVHQNGASGGYSIDLSGATNRNKLGFSTLNASTTLLASENIPAGAAPTTPNDGDIWKLTSGLFIRDNSVTQQFAYLASPAFTGVPTVPTAAANTNTIQAASCAFVTSALTALGGNPSVPIGLTAQNGTESTYLRSDGAPALSQAIIPTWTGVHTFSQVGVGTGINAIAAVVLSTSTAATSSNQSYNSPAIEFDANGWNATSTTSNIVKYRLLNQAVVTGAVPSSNFTFQSNTGSGWSTQVTIDNFGNIYTGLINGNTGSIAAWSATISQNNITSTTTQPGLYLRCANVPASLGSYFSPSVVWSSDTWNSTSSNYENWSWYIDAEPVTGATTMGQLVISSGVGIGSSNTGASTLTNQLIINSLGQLSLSTNKTTVNGSTSGTAVFSQPMKGQSWKKVIIYCNALLGTASYTFPTAFTNTPAIVSTNGPASSVVSSLNNTSITITGATTTGFIIIEGY